MESTVIKPIESRHIRYRLNNGEVVIQNNVILIRENFILVMTPGSIMKYVKIFKKVCVKKDATIKRLKNQANRHKKIITMLQVSLTELKKQCFLLPKSFDIIKD